MRLSRRKGSAARNSREFCEPQLVSRRRRLSSGLWRRWFLGPGISAVTSPDKFVTFSANRDWRISLGIGVTTVWIAGCIAYVVWATAGDPAQRLSLEVVGGFLEGAFAPLAFLWLVLGLFIQQRELANNTEVLRKTSEQSAMQTQAIAATEMNARQETFFKIAESVKYQLGGISGLLYVSGLGPVGSGRFDRDQMDAYFNQMGRGDHELFARMFISNSYLEEGGLEELLYGTEIRRRHSRNFMRTFERLLRLAKNCDVDDIIQDSLRQSALGLLYRRMVDHMPADLYARRAPPEKALMASAESTAPKTR